jgi:hypothetical protein
MDHGEITEWNLSGAGSQEAIDYLNAVTDHLVNVKGPYSMGTGKPTTDHRKAEARLTELSAEGALLLISATELQSEAFEGEVAEEEGDTEEQALDADDLAATKGAFRHRFAGLGSKVSNYTNKFGSSAKSKLQPMSQAELNAEFEAEDEQERGATKSLPPDFQSSLEAYHAKVKSALATLPDYPEGALKAYASQGSRRLSVTGVVERPKTVDFDRERNY